MPIAENDSELLARGFTVATQREARGWLGIQDMSQLFD